MSLQTGNEQRRTTVLVVMPPNYSHLTLLIDIASIVYALLHSFDVICIGIGYDLGNCGGHSLDQ